MSLEQTNMFLYFTVALVLFATLEAGAGVFLSNSVSLTGTIVSCGEVKSIVFTENALFLGGNFTRVGKPIGSGAPINPFTGAPTGSYPSISGKIYSVLPDHNGGWYIGGSFYEAGDFDRSGIAHIDSNGLVSSWYPGDISGTVYALAYSLDSNIIYIGGNFSKIGSTSCTSLLAVSASSGEIITNFTASIGGCVYSILPYQTNIIIGGAFTSVNGYAISNFAVISAANGTVIPWNAEIDSPVYALHKMTHTNWIVAGGAFTHILGTERAHLAAFIPLLETNSLQDWDVAPNSNVYAIIQNQMDENRLYVGGDFTQIGGKARAGIAEILPMTAAITTWQPDIPTSPPLISPIILTLAISPDGSNIFAGGIFNGYAVGIERVTGDLLEWQHTPNDVVNKIAVSADGKKIYLGGAFSLIGGEPRRALALLSPFTGELLSQTFDLTNGTIECMALAPDKSTLYIAGSFTNANGNAITNICALKLSDVSIAPFSPAVSGRITSICLSSDGSNIFIGGDFSSVNGVSRMRLAKIKTTSSEVISTFNVPLNGIPYKLMLNQAGTILYLCGEFTTVAGQSRKYLAAINADTGALLNWAPQPNDIVNDIALLTNGLLAAGRFSNIAGNSHSALAFFDNAGNFQSWGPTFTSSDKIENILPITNNRQPCVVLAGAFVLSPYTNLLALDVISGNVISNWMPNPSESAINDMTTSDDGGVLYIGCDYICLSNEIKHGFSIFSPKYTLKYSAGENGTVSGTLTQIVYHGWCGSSITAQGNYGFEFALWSDGKTNNPRRDCHTSNDINVSAFFSIRKPTGLRATDGSIIQAVQLSWAPSPLAMAYRIFRAANSSNISSAILLATTSATNYYDYNVGAHTNYYYWLQAITATYTSLLTTAEIGFPAVHGPMLIINNMVGYFLSFSKSTPINVSIQMLTEPSYKGVPVDWWAVAFAAYANRWYYLNSSLQWISFDGNLQNIQPAYMGELFDISSPFAILSNMILPADIYYVWFAVDYPMDGKPEPMYLLVDSASFRINE